MIKLLQLISVHHPTTEMAAPACITFTSFSLTCSILKASKVISWVAEAIAIIKPILITENRFSIGDITQAIKEKL